MDILYVLNDGFASTIDFGRYKISQSLCHGLSWGLYHRSCRLGLVLRYIYPYRPWMMATMARIFEVMFIDRTSPRSSHPVHIVR